MATDLDSLRNRRVFEVIPQWDKIQLGTGEEHLKQILGPNQIGFTLSTDNVQPELIYRLPGEWPQANLMPGNDKDFAYFIPQYGQSILSGLKYRHTTGKDNTYTWALPKVVKEDGNTNFSSADFKNYLDLTGNLASTAFFTTNRQSLTYLYRLVSNIANTSGNPIPGQLIYYDIASTGNTGNYLDLCVSFNEQIGYIANTIVAQNYVLITDFNTYKQSVSDQFNAVDNTMLKVESAPTYEGLFTKFITNKLVAPIPQDQMYYNTSTSTLSTNNIQATTVNTSKLYNSTGAVLIESSTGMQPIHLIDVNGTTQLVISKDSVIQNMIKLSVNTSDILSISPNLITIPNSILGLTAAEIIVQNRLQYNAATIDTNTGGSWTAATNADILCKIEIEQMIDVLGLQNTGTNNYLTMKFSDDEIKTQGALRVWNPSGIDNIIVTDDSLIGYNLDGINTPRDLGIIHEGSFITANELKSYIDSIAPTAVPLSMILDTSSSPIGSTIRKSSTGFLEPTNIFMIVDEVTGVPQDIAYATSKCKFAAETLLFSEGLDDIYFDNPSLNPPFYFKPLTYMASDPLNYDRYVPNTREILKEIDANIKETSTWVTSEDKKRPIKIPTSYKGGQGSLISTYTTDHFLTGAIDPTNSIIFDAETDANGNTQVRYFPGIKIMATPLSDNDSVINKKMVLDVVPSDGDIYTLAKWAILPEAYTNWNIGMVANPANSSNIYVNPTKISILNYIGNTDTSNNTNDGDLTNDVPTDMSVMISPLTYTFSDDYISKFMSGFVGADLASLIEGYLLNVNMYTERDILPKCAIRSLVETAVNHYAYKFITTVVNSNFSYKGDLTITTNPVTTYKNLPQWNTPGAFILMKNGTDYNVTDVNSLQGFNVAAAHIYQTEPYYIYITNKTVQGDDFDYVLNNLTVSDYFEIDVINFDDITKVETKLGTLTFNPDGNHVSTIVPAQFVGYGTTETGVENRSIKIYRLPVILKNKLLEIPENTDWLSEEINPPLVDSDNKPLTIYYNLRLNIAPKQIGDGAYVTPTLQIVTAAGRTTANPIQFTGYMDVGKLYIDKPDPQPSEFYYGINHNPDSGNPLIIGVGTPTQDHVSFLKMDTNNAILATNGNSLTLDASKAIFNTTVAGLEPLVPDDFVTLSYFETHASSTESGPDTSRPVNPNIGTPYFDTTLGHPIWYAGNDIWVNATGAQI